MARPPPQCRGPCAECHEGVWGAAVLREGARILSPGGVLALTDNNPQSAVIQVRALERGQRECFSQPKDAGGAGAGAAACVVHVDEEHRAAQ